MDAMMMLKTAIALLLIAATGGLVMAGIRYSRQANPPAWLAMLHGLLAGAALTLLLYAALVAGLPTLANAGIAVLLLAAAGGAFLNLAYQWRQKLIPVGIVLLHAALALTGFLLLAVAAFGG